MRSKPGCELTSRHATHAVTMRRRQTGGSCFAFPAARRRFPPGSSHADAGALPRCQVSGDAGTHVAGGDGLYGRWRFCDADRPFLWRLFAWMGEWAGVSTWSGRPASCFSSSRRRCWSVCCCWLVARTSRTTASSRGDGSNKADKLMQVKNETQTGLTAEIRIVPLWAWVLAGIVFVAAQVFFNVAVARHSGGPPAWARPLLGLMAGIAGGCYLLLIGYINRDAKRRGMSPTLWTIMAVIIPNALDIILLSTATTARRACPQCGYGVQSGFNFCPRCSYKLSPSCPQCQPAPRLA